MGIKRIVDTSFWTDGKVDEFTPEDKYFMLYLLTNPFTTQLGIYEISIKQVAFQLGYSMDAVKALLERFESTYDIIIYSRETNEIAIKNFLQHSIIKGGAAVRDCLVKEIRGIKNKTLIAKVFEHLQSKPTYSETVNTTVRNIITEYFQKDGNILFCNEKPNNIVEQYCQTILYNNDNENENENENGNDNGNEKRERVEKTTHTLFLRLLSNYIFDLPEHEELTAKISDWLTYKAERNESYKEQGLKALLRQIENNALKFGDQAVCNLIDECMGNNWKGIIFERLKKESEQQQTKGSFETDNLFNAALERTYKTAKDDEKLRERMELLRERLNE